MAEIIEFDPKIQPIVIDLTLSPDEMARQIVAQFKSARDDKTEVAVISHYIGKILEQTANIAAKLNRAEVLIDRMKNT